MADKINDRMAGGGGHTELRRFRSGPVPVETEKALRAQSTNGVKNLILLADCSCSECDPPVAVRAAGYGWFTSLQPKEVLPINRAE